MTTEDLVTLRFDHEAGGNVIAGWIDDGHDREQYFAGWLGLLTLLEEARQTAAPEPKGGKADDA